MKDRFIDDYRMLIEYDWEDKPALANSVFRTAFLDMINGTNSTDACYYKNQIFRHPTCVMDKIIHGKDFYNDGSRDDLIMDHVSRKFRNIRLPEVRYKISDKFCQTPDMWLWMRAIRGHGFAEKLFLRFHLFTLPKLLKRNEKLWEKGANEYWSGGILGRFPFYSFHLLAWMLYVLKESELKSKLSKIMFRYVLLKDPTNLLIRKLLGGKIEQGWVNEYEPKTDLRWQRMMERLPPGVVLDDYYGPYPFDKDILCVIAKL